jgi:hypothetical protein
MGFTALKIAVLAPIPSAGVIAHVDHPLAQWGDLAGDSNGESIR